MCKTVWNHVTLVQSLVRRYPCEPFDAHQVLSCPAGLINFWKIIRFAGTWRLARSLTIPQAEATVCHCNFMLIERRELFKMSFSPPFLLFLTVPLSSLSFIIFFIFTPRTLNLVHTQSEILLLLSSTMAFVSDKSAVTKQDAEKTRGGTQKTRGGTQQPAGSDVCEETQCSAISATRNWCFTRWSSAKQYSIAVALVSSVCWESCHCLVCGFCMF